MFSKHYRVLYHFEMETLPSFWKRIILLAFVLMTTSVDEGDFVHSASASDWTLNPVEEYVTAYINLTYLEGEKLHTEKTEIGKFGTGKVGSASGLVVHVTSLSRNSSHFGCDFPYGNTLPNEPWIALVKRGNCTFDEKLRNAYRSNASALVVYAREDKDTLDRMSFKDCTYCNIPTVFTYRWKGEEIARYVDRGTRVYMYITVGETVARPYNNVNKTSVLFVSISFIVLMIISLAWLIFYYVQRFRHLHASDRKAQDLLYKAKKALAQIPTRNVKMTDKDVSGDGECCAVCIELYRSGEMVRTLPCRHEFHKLCVDPWLLEHRTCPMCKMDILKHFGYETSGSRESILHLDMDDRIINSSESRETESPIHDNQRHQRRHSSGEISSSVITVAPPEQHLRLAFDHERNASLVSVTVVSIPKAPQSPLESRSCECSRPEKSLSRSSFLTEEKVSLESTSDHSLKNNASLNSLTEKNPQGRSDESIVSDSRPFDPDDPTECITVTNHEAPPLSSSLRRDCNSLPRSQSSEKVITESAETSVEPLKGL